ncbi:MAG: hypothetical protein FWG42_08975 [Clostridiales bacterium]|nr:hypothetical protein [Clostridiales bacterium]
MQRKKHKSFFSWLLVLSLVFASGIFTFAGDFAADEELLQVASAASDAVKYAPVRTIKTPVAGHYPVSFYRNSQRDHTTLLVTNAGVTQTLSWIPAIDDRGFLTNTAYTAILELEPVSNQWVAAGWPGTATTANFNTQGLTWENVANLPTEGIKSITSEYYSGLASGNYGIRPEELSKADPAGPNLRIFINFEPTAAEKSPVEIVFFDDFSGSLKTGATAVNGLPSLFVRGPEQHRQSMSYWNASLSGVKPDPKDPSNNVLELGWRLSGYDRTNQMNWNSGSLTTNVRPTTPPAAFGASRNVAGNDTLEILLDVAIYDVIWMGKDYLADMGSTPALWEALTLGQKLDAWNSVSALLKNEIWDAYWPVGWTHSRDYTKWNHIDSGCLDLRGNSSAGVAPFISSYGYYEANIKMTPVNGIWTAMWMPYDNMNPSMTSDASIQIPDMYRINTANPLIANMTQANQRTYLANQASWSRCEIDIIENCEPVLEGGYSSSFHFGDYGSYHQEQWMPYDSSPEQIALAEKINLYDGNFHRIGFEWSPTDAKFYIDDYLTAQSSDISTHWPEFVQSKGQVLMLPYLDGKQGIPQNPQYVRLSVEAANWSGHGIEYMYYPYDCGVGIQADRSLGRLTEGTAENGGAATIDYIKIYNGPKPPVTVVASLSTDTVSYYNDDAEYTLSLAYAMDVLAVETEFEIDSSMLAGKGVEGLNGFEAMNNILWVYAGGNTWKGTVTLALPSGSTTGLTSITPVDIAKFSFAPKGFGNAAMTLTGYRVVGLDGTTIYLTPSIKNGTATTIIARSKYDLNRDGVVDALDLGIMLLYCGFDSDSPNWATAVKVNDAWGNGVTASMCDVNSDGLIDMLDLLDLFIHYSK